MIETKNLTKTFDSFTAVDSLDLRIETGEFFGLLGPNGAGKNYYDQSAFHFASAHCRRDPDQWTDTGTQPTGSENVRSV